MGRHKDFDAARAEQQGEPLTFTLGGQDFTVRAEIPSGPLLNLADRANLEDAAAFAAFGDFLKGVVVPGDREAFEAVMNEVGIQTLLALVQWVVEETTGRPLAQRSSSPEPSSDNGQPSRVVSLSPVTPEARSA